MKRIFRVAIVLAIIALILFLLTPSTLVNSASPSLLPEDLDGYLATSENAANTRFPLIPGTEKRIRWQAARERTEYSIVYLHGFSASRQEIVPAIDSIADALGANVFETRLTGHGRSEGAMLETTAEDWLADTAEALAIGALIGEKVIVFGTSTGATLAIAMSDQPDFAPVDTVVLMSPNFGPPEPAAQWLTRPGGPLLAQLLLGDTRSWEPRNEQQALFWTTSYPTPIVVEVMRLVRLAESKLPLRLDQAVLALVSPNDGVISTELMMEGLGQIEASRMELQQFNEVGDLMNHVLAGDILSPDNTAAVVDAVVGFVRDGQ